MAMVTKNTTVDILLGSVKGDAHQEALAATAAWLDQTKFPCTFSIRERFAWFSVSPRLDGPSDMSFEDFRYYVYELVVYALNRELKHQCQSQSS
jgi:hypothetical protein